MKLRTVLATATTAAVLPLRDGEQPTTLGEGTTPLHDVPALARDIGAEH